MKSLVDRCAMVFLAFAVLGILATVCGCDATGEPPAPPPKRVGDPASMERCYTMASDIQALCNECGELAVRYAPADCESEMAINAACHVAQEVDEAELALCYDWIDGPLCSQAWTDDAVVHCFEAFR